MLILVSIFSILVSISCVSAASQVYVNTDGDDSNPGTIDQPFLTIGKGISSVDPNGTVNIANGIYSGSGNTGLTISRNMTIKGQSQTGTIINGTNSAQIFHIQANFNVTVLNLTFTNGGLADTEDDDDHTWGGAIANDGYLTVVSCTFTGNTAPVGGAICNFEQTCIVKNCTFIGNTATAPTGNPPRGGGAIAAMGTFTIEGCIFINNTAAGEGGAIFGLVSTVNFCRFYGNTASTGNAICNYGIMNAENNWWGSNTDPTSISNLIAVVSGSVDANPWLIMAYSVNPTTISQGSTSTLTVDLTHNSNGEDISAQGHIPDGTPVTFTTNLGNVGSKSIVIGTLNGVATATLRGDEGAGEALTSANLDDQTLTAILAITSVNVDSPPVTNTTSRPIVNAASSTNKVNAATKTIPMQSTGVPLIGLLLAILAVLGGLVSQKTK